MMTALSLLRPRSSVLLLVLVITGSAYACTNLLVTPGASADGSSMIAYNADGGTLLGMLYHYPATFDNPPGTQRLVYSWDSGAYLGRIPEARSTYNVVGNSNCRGLTIAETTFGGIAALAGQEGAVLDYGSLIYITLQRAATAREAIDVMTSLMDEYGYASAGETFSLADSRTGEVWMLEVIGRGPKRKGAVWVAVRIPDGAVAAHANQARITTFSRDDPENCLYAEDVVDLALRLGLYERPHDDPTDSRFSFSDTYDPLTYGGVRTCEARVWSLFSTIMKKQHHHDDFQRDFTDYVTGKDYSHRMPLYVTVAPSARLTLQDVDDLMSGHYEHSPLRFDDKVAAGVFETPYRPRPLAWDYHNTSYVNERAVATQQTAWSFIAQLSPSKPQCSTILWFGLDDSSTAPRVPVYNCATKLSEHYGGRGSQDGVPSAVFDFDINKAFWVQNMVSNFAYDRWKSVYPVVKERRRTVLQDFVADVTELEQEEFTVQQATDFTVQAGDKMHRLWWAFYGELFAKFRDYYSFEKQEGEESCGCTNGAKDHPVYDDAWKKRIVEEDGEWYTVKDGSINDHSDTSGPPTKKSGPDGKGATPPLRGILQDLVLDDGDKLENLRPIDKFDLKAFQ